MNEYQLRMKPFRDTKFDIYQYEGKKPKSVQA